MENLYITGKRNMYADAIQVQNAVNLSGIVKSWAEAMEAIWQEAREIGAGTDYVNNHPVNILFANKVYWLTGGNFETAYRVCQEKSAGA